MTSDLTYIVRGFNMICSFTLKKSLVPCISDAVFIVEGPHHPKSLHLSACRHNTAATPGARQYTERGPSLWTIAVAMTSIFAPHDSNILPSEPFRHIQYINSHSKRISFFKYNTTHKDKTTEGRSNGFTQLCSTSGKNPNCIRLFRGPGHGSSMEK